MRDFFARRGIETGAGELRATVLEPRLGCGARSPTISTRWVFSAVEGSAWRGRGAGCGRRPAVGLASPARGVVTPVSLIEACEGRELFALDLWPLQARMARALDDGVGMVVAALGRRGGKTAVAAGVLCP